MDNKKLRKVVVISLAALLIGSIFFIFGISLTSSIFPLVVNYIIAMLLFISAFLSIYNNNKPKVNILTYMEILIIGFIILITYVFINRIL